MGQLRQFQDHWMAGFILLARLIYILLVGGLAVGAPLWAIGDLTRQDPQWWADWTLYTLPAWAPFWAGYLRRDAWITAR